MNFRSGVRDHRFPIPPDRLNIRRLRRNVTNLVISGIHERASLEGPQPLQVTNQVGWDAPLGSSQTSPHSPLDVDMMGLVNL